MGKKVEIQDEKHSMKNGYGRITEYDSYRKGTVLTHHGIVEVYSMFGYWPGIVKHTSLDMMHKGYLHTRTFNRSYSARYLVTLAKRFAEDVLRDNGDVRLEA